MDFPQTCRNCGFAQTGVGPCRNCGDLVAPESIGDSMVQLGEFPEISRFDLEIDTTLDVGAEAARSLDVAQVSLPVADESAAAVDCGPLSMIPDASRPHAKRKDADFGFSLHQAESQRLRLSYNEVTPTNSIATIKLSKTHIASLCMLFADVDTNDDGTISQEDFLNPENLNIHSTAEGFAWWKAFKEDLIAHTRELPTNSGEVFTLKQFIYAFKHQLAENQLHSTWSPTADGLDGKMLHEWITKLEYRFNTVILDRIVTAHRWHSDRLGKLGFPRFKADQLIHDEGENFETLFSITLEQSSKDCIDELFTLLDTNGPTGEPDGKLCEMDFAGFQDATCWKQLREQFDMDGNGYIDRNEFQSGFKKWVAIHTPIRAGTTQFEKMDGWLYLIQSAANREVHETATHLMSRVLAARDGVAGPAQAAAGAPPPVDAEKATFNTIVDLFTHCLIRNVSGHVSELAAQIPRVQSLSAVVATTDGANPHMNPRMYNVSSDLIKMTCMVHLGTVLEKAGVPPGEFKRVLCTGGQVYMILLPNEGNMCTTWYELINSIRINQPDVMNKLTRFCHDFHTKKFADIEADAKRGFLQGSTYREVFQIGKSDPRFMTQDRFMRLDKPTLAHARGFLFHEMLRFEDFGCGDGIDWAVVRNKVQFAVTAGPSNMAGFLDGFKPLNITKIIQAFVR